MNASHRRPVAVVAVALVVLLATGCGTRVEHDQVERAAGIGSAAASGAVDGLGVPGGPEADGGGEDAAAADTETVAVAADVGSAPGTDAAAAGPGAPGPAAPGATDANSGPPTGSPIALGNVGTYSGVVGSSVGAAEPMVKVWAQWVNQHGGINGHPVVVYTADDGGDPSKARALSQQMVEEKGVVAFVGSMIPVTAAAVAEYAKKVNVPVVGGDLSAPDWNEHAMLFPQGTGAFELYEGAAHFDAKFIDEAGGNKWGAVYCTEDSACEVSYKETAAAAPKAGLNPVYGEAVTLTQPSYTAQCLNAKSKGVHILQLTLDANSVSRLARDCTAQGYKPLYASGSVIVTSDLAKDPNLDRLISIQSTFGWTYAGSAAAKEYQDAVQSIAPSLAVSAATSAVWTSGKLLEKALQAVSPSATVTSQDVLEGLYQLRDETLGGLAPPLNFVRDKPAPGAACYFGVQIDKGEWISLNEGQAYC